MKPGHDKHENQYFLNENTNIFMKFDPFYFQARESPAPLNTPTPTRAPDRGGPIACLSGPVDSGFYKRE